jgi:hypothetical protein
VIGMVNRVFSITVSFGLFIAIALGANDDTWSKRFPSTTRIGGIASLPDGYALTFDTATGACVATIDSNGAGIGEQCFPGDVPTDVTSSGAFYFLYGHRDGPPNVRETKLWIGKFDRNNRPVWARRMIEPAEVSIVNGAATSDGGVILVGGRGEPFEHRIIYPASAVMKLTSDGSPQWFREIDVTGYELVNSVREVKDGYVITASAEAGVRITKLDRNGNVSWHQWLSNGNGYTYCESLNNGDILVGAAADKNDYLIARLNAAGQILWQKRSAPMQLGVLQSLNARGDGTFIMRGREMINGSYADFLVAFSAGGDVIWQRAVFLAKGASASVSAMAPDGGIVLGRSAGNVVEIHKFSASGQPPGALEPVTIVTDISFSSVRSVPVAPPVETASLVLRLVDDPVTARTQALVVDVAKQATRPVPASVPAPVKPERQSALAAAQEIVDQESELTTRVISLLSQRKFADLEQMASGFRESAAEFASSYRKLALFYASISTPALEYGTEQQHLQLVEDWMKASPSSATAAVASAQTYINYASAARGQSYANTVTDEAWKKFQKLMARARDIVVASKAFAAADPEYQASRVMIAGPACDHLEELIHDPQLMKVGDFTVWRIAGQYFLPRWCGTPDAYRRLAELAASSTRAKYGDGLYALIAFDAVRIEQDRQTVAPYKFEWPRIRQGFLDLIQRYPNAPLNYHRLAVIARFFDDRATARMTFEKPVIGWDSFATLIWTSQYEFEQSRTWAMTDPSPSFVTPSAPQTAVSTSGTTLRKPQDGSTSWVAAGVANWPPLLLITDMRMQDGTSHRSNAFLVQTKAGVVAISSLSNLGTPVEVNNGPGIPPRKLITPMPLDSFKTRLLSWTMSAPQKPAQKLTVAAIEPKTQKWGHGVVLTLAPVRGLLPVRVLQPQAEPVPGQGSGKRLFLVACRGGSDPCVQTALAGTWDSGSGSPGHRILSVLLDEPADLSDLDGSPLIDENGNVVGVAIAMSSSWSASDKPGSVRLDSEEINSVLAKAGL